MGIIYDCGNGVRLQPLTKSLALGGDGPIRYRRWMTDEEVTRFNSHGLFPKGDREIQAWLDDVESGKNAVTFAILFDGVWVGVCSLQSLNWINRSAEVAIYIGERNAWGRGIATKAVRALLRHGFQRLGLFRIWSGTAATNKGMNRVFQKLDFRMEGSFRSGMFLDGHFVDIHCYSILKGEYDDDSARE